MVKTWSRTIWIFIFAGAAFGSLFGYSVYDFVWTDARFCTSCHTHDVSSDSWENSAHHQYTTCHDCHHQSLHTYVRQAVGLWVNPETDKDKLKHQADVPTQVCESCHFAMPPKGISATGPYASRDLSKTSKIDSNFLHKVHLRHKKRVPRVAEEDANLSPEGLLRARRAENLYRNIACSDCHGQGAESSHDVSVPESACRACHAGVEHTEVLKNNSCQKCHYLEFALP